MTPPTTVTLPTPRGLRVVGWMMLALETFGVAWLVAAVDDVGLLVSSTVPMLVGAAIAVGLLACTLRVQVDAHLATFSFLPFFRRSVCACEIDEVVVRDRVSPAEVGGVGLRRAPGRTTALLWGPGPGVEVRLHDGGRLVVVTDQAAPPHDRLAAMSC